MRTTGTCKTCGRKNVTLISAVEKECSVCHRVAGVADKILNGKPTSASDMATMRRVLAAHQAGVTTSIETKVAEKKGYIELFAGARGKGATPPQRPASTDWPRPVSGWQCSDGTLVADEVTALKHELDLMRSHTGTAQ